MSTKTGISIDNSNLKFLELKKYVISGGESTADGVKSVAIDNHSQTVFAITSTHLLVTPLPQLLAFEWNKSVINETVERFPHFKIALNFTPHLISISAAGFGHKIAVCGADYQSSTAPFIVFFDVSDVHRNQSQSLPFNRINLFNSTGHVSDIVWHPELNDQCFGCCVSDGSFFLVSIGDPASKQCAILADIRPANGVHALSMCWSPKGKQLVVGHRSGFISQYKLTASFQLQEVKRTPLVGELSEHRVIAVKWIVSSLFAIAVTKESAERDTHFLLVSTPSKAPPLFVDFGPVCYDNIDGQHSYAVNLMHYENLILCSTSMASEVAVVGCDPDKDVALPDNWCLWALDDSSRIDLPIDSAGNETSMKGMVVSRGTQNIYKLNVNETYGGVDCPVLLVYNSAGILVPYLMIDKTGRLRSPCLPPNIQKPAVTPSPMPSQSISSQPKPMTSTPILSADSLHTKPTPKVSAPAFGIPVTPVPSLTTDVIKAVPKPPEPKPQTPASNQQPVHQSTLPAPEYKSHHASGGQSATGARSPTAEETAAATHELYMTAIKEQIIEFKKLMAETSKKFSQIKVKIGEKEEQMRLRSDTRLIEDVLKEIKENFRSTGRDTSTLQSSLIESFSLLEEAKSIMNRNVDPNYRHLLRQRALDPITSRRMQDILALNAYIETQLRELDAKFEQEWYEWLDKRKALKGKPPARLQGNSGLDLIYKTLANNQRAISALKIHVDSIDGASPDSVSTLGVRARGGVGSREATPDSPHQKLVDKLSQTMDKTTIKDIPDANLPIDRVFKLKTISAEKLNNLRQFFENRAKVPVRRAVDNSSRFMSAIKKLKDKEKSIQTASPAKSDSFVANRSAADQRPPLTAPTVAPQMTSIDNKVIITPTVVTKSPERPVPTKPVETPAFAPKLSLNLPSLSSPFDLNAKSTPTVPLVPSKTTGAAKSADVFQSFASKPLSFSLSATPVNTAFKSTPMSSTPAKPTPTAAAAPVVQNLISAKPTAESVPKKPEKPVPVREGSPSNASKSVSFGNTTIINPLDTTPDDDDSESRDRLDTITELSETNDSSATNSPFTAFKGFGGTNDSSAKLAFNLSGQSTTGFSFNSTLEATKQRDPLPKYEDISPPSTPQRTAPQVVPKQTPIVSTDDSNGAKPVSILKALISGQSSDDKENASKPQTSTPLPSLTAINKVDVVSPTPLTASITTSAPAAGAPQTAKPSLLAQLITGPPSPTSEPSTTTSPLAALLAANQSTNGTTTQKPDSITSPLGFGQTAPAFGQTPFANSFSFGNTAAPTATSATSPATPAFGNICSPTTTGGGLAFGGSTGFGSAAANQTPATTPFNQQQPALNNMSFGGLGGRPSAESASKNAFGGAFSSPALNTGFAANAQPSGFAGFKTAPAAGGFGSGGSGSFSTGSGGVAQTGFAAFQSSPGAVAQQQPTQPVFGGAPAFGGSPTFGGSPQQPAFGGSPSFGGAPQQPAFGSAPAFGGAPAFGSMGSTGFGGQSAFGANTGFASTAGDLSFGALASSAQQQGSPQQPTATPFGGGFSGFGSSSDAFSFTQRRK